MISDYEIVKLERDLPQIETKRQEAINFLMGSPSLVLGMLILLKELTEFMLVYFKEKKSGALKRFGWKIFFNKKIRKEFGDILLKAFEIFTQRDMLPLGDVITSYYPIVVEEEDASKYLPVVRSFKILQKDSNFSDEVIGEEVLLENGKWISCISKNEYELSELMLEYRFSPNSLSMLPQ